VQLTPDVQPHSSWFVHCSVTSIQSMRVFNDCRRSANTGRCFLSVCQTGMALTLCQQLASAMGPSIKQHVRSLGPGIVNNFGDSKVS